MRFVLVDRVVTLEPGRLIETVKNVAASEDIFDDHFPGVPVFPGALIVEAFEQAVTVLVAVTTALECLPRCAGLSRVRFRRLVRPGDQLRVLCRRRAGDGPWIVDAEATVDGRPVAGATLELTLEPAAQTPGRRDRVRALIGVVLNDPAAALGLPA